MSAPNDSALNNAPQYYNYNYDYGYGGRYDEEEKKVVPSAPWQQVVAEFIQQVMPPVIMAIGGLGNLLSLVVMMRKAMRSTSTCFYLGVLAIADTMVLYVGGLKWWLQHITSSSLDIRVWSDCRVYSFIYYFSSHFASWLLVVMTIERCISIYAPLYAHMYCTTEKAKIVIGSLAFIIFGINVSHLGLSRAGRQGSVKTCVGTTGPNEYYNKVVWVWLDSLFYSFLPVGIIFFVNIMIIAKMYARKRELQTEKKMKSSLSANANRMTRMLLVVSTAFLISTSPSVIVSIVFPNVTINSARGVYLFNACAVFMMFCNHAMNFFLYCASGQKFREELCALLRCKSNTVKPTTRLGDSSTRAVASTANGKY